MSQLQYTRIDILKINKSNKVALGMLVTTMMMSSQISQVSAIEHVKNNSYYHIQDTMVNPQSHLPVTVNGGNLALQSFTSFSQALTAIENDDGQDYTILLNSDVQLEANQGSNIVVLPHKNIVINGNGHQLSQPVTSRNYLYSYGNLTLENVELDMKKTYLYNYGEGITIELNGYVTGTLELIRDQSDKNSEKMNQIIVHSPVKKSTVSSINGNGKNGTTQIILEGYGSKAVPASKNDYPGIGSSADSAKPAAFILQNSYINADYAYNWGNLYIEGESGIAITGTMQYATIPNYYVADDAKASLIVKKFSSGFGCLKVNGEVTGQTEILIAGNTMPQSGDILIDAKNASDDAFILTGVSGMTLVKQSDGKYLVAEKKYVSVNSASMSESYRSLDDAINAINSAVENGSTETYTITLLEDITLNDNIVLPNTAIIIDGNNHTLNAADNVEKIDVTKSLVMTNINLSLSQTTLHYAPVSGTRDRFIELSKSATGHVGKILDDSQNGYLDIKLYNTVQVDKIIGTNRANGSRLTDLYLTDYGTKDQPYDLSQMTENLAAVELDNSFLSLSSEISQIDVIRTKNAQTNAGIVINDDTTIDKLSIGQDPQFNIIIQDGKKLTIKEKSGLDNIRIPVWINGSLADGQTVIEYQGRVNDDTANMFTIMNDEAKLYYRQETKSFEISLSPAISIINDQTTGQDGIFSKFAFNISDVQGLDHITINNQHYQLNSENSLVISSLDEQWSFKEGENTIELYDKAMAHTAYHFIYDTTAPEITYQIHNQQIMVTGNEAITIQQNGWTKINDQTWSKQLKDEKTIDLIIYDLAGNSTNLHINMSSISVSQNQSQQMTHSIKTGDHSPVAVSAVSGLLSFFAAFVLKKKYFFKNR